MMFVCFEKRRREREREEKGKEKVMATAAVHDQSALDYNTISLPFSTVIVKETETKQCI